ncbi:hypothetical protein VNO78_15312 [Psophocarpus tetragonolobus]|uniref:Uncharacterized protein n=1 Tax=Psophocarpus tetragonolobus TaxID=3891 RepID=A0AAN9SDT7_PSOTE
MARSCQISKHARLCAHARHEREPNLVRRISHASLARTLAGRTSLLLRLQTLSGAALPSPYLDPAGFLPFSVDLAGPPLRWPGIAVPDGVLKIPARRRWICRKISCGIPEYMACLI